jgi:histidinol phosphatase-like PHP family hydrolase
MARYRVALRNPHVDIIAHPSGRKIDIRDDLDLDWEAFYREAADTGTILEVNGSDERLDLDDRRARAALEAGLMRTTCTSSTTSTGACRRPAARGSSRAACSTRCRSTSSSPRSATSAN